MLRLIPRLACSRKSSIKVVTHNAGSANIFGVGYAVALEGRIRPMKCRKAGMMKDMVETADQLSHLLHRRPLDIIFMMMSVDYLPVISSGRDTGEAGGCRGPIPDINFFQASFGERLKEARRYGERPARGGGRPEFKSSAALLATGS
jgi:hypothetical protein